MTDFEDDAQRRAFTEAGESDWAAQAKLLKYAVVHDPDSSEPIVPPEAWDAADWDSQRQPPKTLVEAQAALAGRVADLDAPDADSTAYDQLEGP